MYHTSIPTQTMVHVMGSYPGNGQYLPLQNHAYFVHSPANLNQTDLTHLCRNSPNHSRHRLIQATPHPYELLHLMCVENSPQRNSVANPNGITWQRKVMSPACNSSNVASITPQVNPRPVSAGASKKQTWNNIGKHGKRHSHNDLSSLHETYNSSDSGLSSRSPTPNRYFKDDSQTESSDDRESVNSTSDPGFRFMRQNSNNSSKGNLVTSVSTQNLYQNDRVTCQYQDHSTRSQVPNYQAKRRYLNGRNSPSKTQKNRKFPGVVFQGYNVYPRFYYTAPDRFLQKSRSIHIIQKPNNLLVGSPYDKLSKAMWEKFELNQQTETIFCNKMYLWKCLQMYIRSKYPQYGLFMVGSTLNGFGTNSSDVDMCLLLRNAEMDQKNEAIYRLEQIYRCLKKCEFIEHLELIQAKVPILKFHNSTFGLDIDLNCNNAVGIRNTHLLYCYSQIDWRVRPLALIVKMWAQSQDINDAKHMTISSYSLILMVIHFLQCGVDSPVLPCLHEIYKGKFNPFSDVHSIDIHEELIIPNYLFFPRNQQCLGELLIDFFKYYESFNYDQYAISVRVADKIPIEHCRLVRSYKNDPHQWRYLCIEEPFDFTNTARSVYDPTVFLKIKEIIRETYLRLQHTNDLSSIFVKLDVPTPTIQ